jgi:N-methylhydantoinase A
LFGAFLSQIGERSVTYRLGVDVGGTFTDVVLYDSDSQRVWLAKTPSTPLDQSVGVIDGIRLAAGRADVGLPDLDAVLHGTTVATNAVLERRGALVGLVVTNGFRQILHLAEAWTPGPLFGFMIYEKPEPLTDTRYVREVPERIGADGAIIEPIDEGAVRTAIRELVEDGIEALTVCLLNAHANGRHERVVAEIAASIAPSLPVSISSEVLPEFREYERTVTTLVNAYVAPTLERYLTNVRDGLAAAHVRAPIQVVRSDGGLMSLESAVRNPVQTVLSGPAGGVSGASFVTSHAGFDRILTFDMGGTSTDVAVCVSGRPEITRETHVGDFPVRAPAVDVASIGAGGGSIAYVAEATGALRVGPESAGAVPGPACYGRGGSAATVTDANVVLGHLPPRLLGGEFELDPDAARAAVARVAEARGTRVEETARAIVSMVDEAMLGALRVVTVQRGRVPSEFALVAFGGAGGLHANALARILGSYPVIVPEESGVLSALGFISSEIKNEYSQTFVKSIAATTPDAVRKPFEALTTRAREWLDAERVDVSDQDVRFVVDMRYTRQGYELPIELDGVELAALDLAALERRFGEAHQALYGFVLDGGAEIVNLRVVAAGRVPFPELEPRPEGGADPSAAQTGTHRVWTPEEALDVPTYARAALEPGMAIEGYAIVEQYDATTVVLPGHRAVVDAWRNLLIRPAEAM